MAELKAAGEGAKGAQCLRHLARQLGLHGAGCPAPAPSGSRGAAGWAGSGRKPTKKLRHGSLAELGAAEAKHHGEATFCRAQGKASPADIFTKAVQVHGWAAALEMLHIAKSERG